jgi:hypothetical protein
MGSLAAGTLDLTIHPLANMPPRGCRHWKGTHALSDRNKWEVTAGYALVATGAATGSTRFVVKERGGLYHGAIGRWYSLHLATHLLTCHQRDAAAGKERTLLQIGTLRPSPLEIHAWPSWDDGGLYHGMIGRWFSLLYM